MRRPLIALLLSLAGVPAAAASASAVTVGETFAANGACDGITLVLSVPSGHNSYVVPTDGVLTSWSTSAESLGHRMGAVVYRSAGSDYVLVGISDVVVPIGAGVKTYPARIPVRAGDLLGSWVEMRDGTHNVQSTCALTGDPDQHSTWWYDTTPDALPPLSPVPMASTHNDTGWTYNISAEVQSLPTVTAVSPAGGPTTGGTEVTITGTGLESASAVTFGANPATITRTAAASLTATTPTGAAGAVDVTVQTPVGSVTLAGAFTYAAGPGDATGPADPPAAPASLGARTTCAPSGRCVTAGAVPDGATRVTQVATGGVAQMATAPFGALATAQVNTSCPITGTAVGRRFSCAVRLGTGRWTLTTTALADVIPLAVSETRIRVKARRHLRVTG